MEAKRRLLAPYLLALLACATSTSRATTHATSRLDRLIVVPAQAGNVKNTCKESELQEWMGSYVKCMRRAEGPIREAIRQGGSLPRPICEAVTEVTRCIEESSSHKCLCPKELSRLRTEYLNRQLQNARTREDLLGRHFVRTCRVLRTAEQALMMNITGSTRCTYGEFIRVQEERDDCVRRVTRTRDGLLDLEQLFTEGDGEEIKRSLYIRSYCRYRREWRDLCLRSYVKCFSKDVAEQIHQGDVAAFRQLEKNLGQSVLPGFTFDQSCSQ